MPTDPLEALTDCMMHLRMVSAGHTSYSATPTRFDLASAEIVMERLHLYGFRVSRRDSDTRPKDGDAKQGPTRE